MNKVSTLFLFRNSKYFVFVWYWIPLRVKLKWREIGFALKKSHKKENVKRILSLRFEYCLWRYNKFFCVDKCEINSRKICKINFVPKQRLNMTRIFWRFATRGKLNTSVTTSNHLSSIMWCRRYLDCTKQKHKDLKIASSILF